MKALVLPAFTGPESLRIQEVPRPQLSADAVMVKVFAGGLNFADVLTAKGGYPGLPKPPLTVGREFSGIQQTTGERVMGYVQWGAFAEFLTAPPQTLWPVPEQWSFAEAAAFPVNYFTAYFAFWKAGLTKADKQNSKRRVLIHAAAGGVGTAAVQIGKVLGVEMYGTSSSQEKLQRLRELGLHHGINYRERDYEEAIRELTNGEGVDAVFEMLGGEHTLKSVRCLCDFGNVIVYGSATGQHSQLDPRVLYAKGTSVHGLWLTQLAKKPEVMAAAWKQLSEWITADKLHPIVGHTVAVERALDAYHLLSERKNFGKVVLRIGEE